MTDAAPSRVLERIDRLIALAASANENEARNAAALAVRMIRNFGVTLSLGGPSPDIHAERQPSSGLAVPVTIHSQYDGRCRSCGAVYRVGDRVQWARGKGAAHLACVWPS